VTRLSELRRLIEEFKRAGIDCRPLSLGFRSDTGMLMQPELVEFLCHGQSLDPELDLTDVIVEVGSEGASCIMSIDFDLREINLFEAPGSLEPGIAEVAAGLGYLVRR